jgi:hypothetical protein
MARPIQCADAVSKATDADAFGTTFAKSYIQFIPADVVDRILPETLPKVAGFVDT